MTSTPLPEQGGFNEKLEAILEHHREWMRGIRTDRLIGASSKQTADAIRTLIREEIIGEDTEGAWNELFPNDRGSGRDVDELKNLYNNELRAEQRLKLGGTHGTK